MQTILAAIGVLTFSVSISIGAYTLSVSGDTQGKIKGDVSYAVGNYSRGYDFPVNYTPDEKKDGIGEYRKASLPAQPLSIENKFYDNGKVSSDLVFSVKTCSKNRVVCVKGAVKKRLYDNFSPKKEFDYPYGNRYLNDVNLGSNDVTHGYMSSYPHVNKGKIVSSPATKPLETNYSSTSIRFIEDKKGFQAAPSGLLKTRR